MTDPSDIKKDTHALPENQTHGPDMEQLSREAVEKSEFRTPGALAALSLEETQQMLYELHAQQIQLELKNEELRRAHEELDMARARYFDLYDTAPVGYCTISRQGLILEANLTAANLLGVTRDSLVKEPLTNFILEEDKDIFYLHRKQLLETFEPQACELRMLKKNSTTLWARLEAKLVQDADNIPLCRFVMSDITEHKRTEEALLQARKMESIGRLAGGVAHDFNNMLQVIIGHTELALSQVDPAQPLFAGLREIQKAAERSATTTRRLLAFARKQPIAPRMLDLNETVGGMLNMLRHIIGEDIDLAWLPGKNLRPVKMDPFQIDEILANLCINAREAIRGIGMINITTGMTSFDEGYCAINPEFIPGDYALLTVSDDGRGMEKETLANLFEPFFTTKEISKGSGLGLATVYGIVKQNNGLISVFSEPGHGTTFKLYLPLHKGSADQKEKESNDGKAQGHETILLVEDEPAILEMAGMLLRQLGYNVLAASTPHEAVRLAEANAGIIRLLLTDVIMPEMNGMELAKNLLSLYPHLKLLFMSGYTADIIMSHGVLDASVNFIQKPFSMKALAGKVREVLDGDRS